MNKRILLAVCGMSPQIVTETLFSLATRQHDQFIPTDIYLITTVGGKEQAEQQLLHPVTGKFHQFCKDYDMPEIKFNVANILVIEDANGQPLSDIKSPGHNEAAADFITNTVREFTLDADTTLHVSIAGGRKTMGYYVGYALSLYGRRQDHLSHVLVTDKYENSKDFFYPTPYSRNIFDRDNKSLDTQDAQVMLAEIPFVRLIDGSVPQFLQQQKVGFSESVRMAQALEDQPLLHITLNAAKDGRLSVSGLKLPVPMTDVNFVFYLWLLKRCEKGEKIVLREALEPNQNYAQEFLTLYKESLHELKDDDEIKRVLNKGMEKSFITDRVSAINRAFTDVLGKRSAHPYMVQGMGKKNDGSYYYLITLKEEQISIVIRASRLSWDSLGVVR